MLHDFLHGRCVYIQTNSLTWNSFPATGAPLRCPDIIQFLKILSSNLNTNSNLCAASFGDRDRLQIGNRPCRKKYAGGRKKARASGDPVDWASDQRALAAVRVKGRGSNPPFQLAPSRTPTNHIWSGTAYVLCSRSVGSRFDSSAQAYPSNENTDVGERGGQLFGQTPEEYYRSPIVKPTKKASHLTTPSGTARIITHRHISPKPT